MIIFIIGAEKLLDEYLKWLYEILVKFEKELGDNFTRLDEIIVAPFEDNNYKEAYHLYDKYIKKGYLFINSDSFKLDINEKIDNSMKCSFECTIIHEIGHHLYEIHNLENKVIQFFNTNNNVKYIEEYLEYDKYKHRFDDEDRKSEFFAHYFCKVYRGELESTYRGVGNKIYDFILWEYNLLKRR